MKKVKLFDGFFEGSQLAKDRPRIIWNPKTHKYHSFTPSKTKNIEREFGWQIKSQWPYQPDSKSKFGISYKFVAGRYDVDNACKLLMDASTGVIWLDDRQVYWVELERIQKDNDNPVAGVWYCYYRLEQ